MDTANRNILTDERNQIIGNTEVLGAALTSDGMWLVTYEAWSNLAIGYKDMLLKLWQFNLQRPEELRIQHKRVNAKQRQCPGLGLSARLARSTAALLSLNRVGFEI